MSRIGDGAFAAPAGVVSTYGTANAQVLDPALTQTPATPATPAAQAQTPAAQAQTPAAQAQTPAAQRQTPAAQAQTPAAQGQAPAAQAQAPAAQAQAPAAQPQAPAQAQRPAVELNRADVFQAAPQGQNLPQGIVEGGCIPPRPFPQPFPLPEPKPLPHPIPLPPFPQPRGDASATKAINELNQKPAPISGQDMANAIEKGTKDLDSQAAGREYKQFSDWAQKNQSKLSPEAQEVMKVYDQAAKAAQAKGQTGIDPADYQKMVGDMKKAASTDVSANKAINELNQKPSPISGQDMANAIAKGTKDLDGQAAGREYKQFSDWAQQNQDKLSPEAKEVMKVYDQAAKAAQAKGQTGLSPAEHQKLVADMKKAAKTDVSASKALNELSQKPAPISGEDMAKAIEKGTKDLDGQAAGREYKQFSDWARKNQDKLSPEAKEVMKVYDQAAKAAQAKGQTGISAADYQKMVGDMKKVASTDVSANKAINELNQKPAPISGEDMAKAIEKGTKDLDNQSAGKEYKQFTDWARQNQDKLSPEAKEVLKVYDQAAKAAQAKGLTGIPMADYQKMVGDMKKAATTDASAAAAINELGQKPAPISGEDMANAIEKGTADHDGQAAGKEYKQFADWAAKNQDKLSPEAKEVLKVYEQAAKAAEAKGQTGIPVADYQKMVSDMKKAAATDVSAATAIGELSKGSGKISGEDMTRAIENGTKDLDNASASREFDQFAKWAEQNPGRLSPEAKQVMDIYKKYADAAKAGGQTGISSADYQKMLGEMKEVKTYKDEGAGQVLDQLNHTSGPVSGQQMLDAIKNGTQDYDGQAAGTELQDFIGWARDNASRLSPDAKKTLIIYMKYATQALVNGQTGINQGDYQKMLQEMKAALQPPLPRPIAI